MGVATTIPFELPGPIAHAATVVLAYPQGTEQADFIGEYALADGVAVISGNDVYRESAGKIDLDYGSTTVTLQNLSGQTWPTGADVVAELAFRTAIGVGTGSGSEETFLVQMEAAVSGDDAAAIGDASLASLVAGTTEEAQGRVNELLGQLESGGLPPADSLLGTDDDQARAWYTKTAAGLAMLAAVDAEAQAALLAAYFAGSFSAWKSPVRAATTAAGTLATSFENGDTIDGVVLATGDRILLKNQAAGAANGIYVVAASGAPARAADADSAAEVLGAVVFVLEGTANADTLFVCTTNAPITLETTTLTFATTGAGYAPGGTDVAVADGGTGGSTPGAALTNLGVSAFMQTVLDDAAAANALTTLGFSAFVQTILDDAAAGDVLTTLGVSAFVQTILNDAAAANVLTTLGIGTAGAPEFASLNLGHPTDTTFTRVSAGVVAIEGANIVTGANPALTTIELGHATDTTFSRVSAGVAAIEGANIITGAVATAAEIWAGTAGNKWISAAVRVTADAPTVVADAATITIDLNAGINFEVGALGATRILAFSNYTGKGGRSGHVVILQDATGSRGLTTSDPVLPSDATGGLIALNDGASEATVIPYYVTAGNKIRLG